MRTGPKFVRATIAAALIAAPMALAAVDAAPAAAATVLPGLLVVNDGANTLTSYPLSSNADAHPAVTVSANGSGSLGNPVGVALDGAGDAWVTNLTANTVVEYSAAQLAAGGTPTPRATLTPDGHNSLSEPTGDAFDSAGDLWVANISTNTVVEYTAAQLAAGGPQTPAVTLASDSAGSLGSPYFIAFDPAGNLWVPDQVHNSLEEFTHDQLTSSGTPTPAVTISADGAGQLHDPLSIAFDRAGDLWTACVGSDSILEYTPSQQAATGAPSPAKTLSSASLAFPTRGVFDAAGDLWVADFNGQRVVEFSAAQVAAGGSPTPADTIQGNDTGLNAPESLAVEQAPTVSSLSVTGGPAGTQVPISGTGFYPGSSVNFGGAPATSVKYLSPYQLTAVAPPGTGAVDVTVSTAFGSSSPSAADRFTYAAAPTVPVTLVAANDAADTLTSFPSSASGNVIPAATLTDGSSNNISFPIDPALDAAGDEWVPSDGANKVLEYTRSQLIAGGNQAPAVTITSNGLASPSSAAFDAAGNLWVTYENPGAVVEYTKAQLAAGGAQVPAVMLQDDGSGSLNDPIGIGFDPAGDLWVSDFTGNGVVEYAKGQLAASGAPVPAVTLSRDAANSLATPDALTFDRRGDLWVTNGINGNSIVEYTPSQFVTGAPTPAVKLTADGSGSLNGSDQAQFDAAGNLWVANYDPFGGAGSIVEFTPAQIAASGSPTPTDTIVGDATGFKNPWGLVIEQAPTVSSVSPAGGPAVGGTSVTISGTGFYPGSTVDFGGTPATTVTYVTPYELTAVAPAGTGTVDVTVTTGQGTSATSPVDQFTYAAAPNPPAPTPVPVPVPRVGSGAHQLKVTGHLAGVPLSCSVATCQGTVRLTRRMLVTVHHGKKTVRRQETVVIGTAHYTLKAGQHATIEVRLGTGTLSSLAQAKQHRLAAHLAVTVSGGATFNENVVLVQSVKPKKG